MLKSSNFNIHLVSKNKRKAVDWLRGKFPHLKNLEIYDEKERLGKTIDLINDKFKDINNNEIHYAIDVKEPDCNIMTHADVFVYGKIDNKPFIMFTDYDSENEIVGFSKIKDNNNITKIVLPSIQSDTQTCFMFQTKVLQTMTPEVIRNLMKDGNLTTHEYTYLTKKDRYTLEDKYDTFKYLAIEVGIEQLPEALISYMQSLSKLAKLNNGEKILNTNRSRGFIVKNKYNVKEKILNTNQPRGFIIKNRYIEKEQNIKSAYKTFSLYSTKNVDDDFFCDLYSVKGSDDKQKRGCGGDCCCIY